MTHRALAILVLLLAFVACGTAVPSSQSATQPSDAAPTPSASPRGPVVVTDDRGKSLTFATPPQRIVSVAPSSTEVVFALGAGDRVVAVDDFSDYPDAAKALPKVGGFKASPEKVVSYRPDVVLAITTGDLVSVLEAQGQRVLVFEPRDIDGVYRSIGAIGSMLDHETSANGLIRTMKTRIAAVAEKTKGATKLRVLHELDATDPTKIFVAGPGNFIDAMIAIAGGVNVAANAATAYPQLSSEEVVRADPQVIVLSDAAYGGSPEAVRARPGWSSISAVKDGRLFPIDPDIVSRPGPRLADGIEAYGKLLHPELFR